MSFKTTDTSVIDIAKELIVHHHYHNDEHDICKLKFQKQLFFAQSLALYYFNQELFKEEIEAWDKGPVVSTIYTEWGKPHGALTETSIRTVNDFEKMILETIFEITKNLSGEQLSDISHEKSGAWEHAYRNDEKNIILKEAIKNTFPVYSVLNELLNKRYNEIFTSYNDSQISPEFKEMKFL